MMNFVNSNKLTMILLSLVLFLGTKVSSFELDPLINQVEQPLLRSLSSSSSSSSSSSNYPVYLTVMVQTKTPDHPNYGQGSKKTFFIKDHGYQVELNSNTTYNLVLNFDCKYKFYLSSSEVGGSKKGNSIENLLSSEEQEQEPHQGMCGGQIFRFEGSKYISQRGGGGGGVSFFSADKRRKFMNFELKVVEDGSGISEQLPSDPVRLRVKIGKKTAGHIHFGQGSKKSYFVEGYGYQVTLNENTTYNFILDFGCKFQFYVSTTSKGGNFNETSIENLNYDLVEQGSCGGQIFSLLPIHYISGPTSFFSSDKYRSFMSFEMKIVNDGTGITRSSA